MIILVVVVNDHDMILEGCFGLGVLSRKKTVIARIPTNGVTDLTI